MALLEKRRRNVRRLRFLNSRILRTKAGVCSPGHDASSTIPKYRLTA